MTLGRKFAAEFAGTAFLLAIVVGSGIMGERLCAGNLAVALLANSIATGAGLTVLILCLGPVSGAHFNPAVSLAMALERVLPWRSFAGYAIAQLAGAVAGVALAHLMFDLPSFLAGDKIRAGTGQVGAEVVATFGLVGVIFACLRAHPKQISAAVGLYITAAYWFTASTSFANPAATVARSMTNTFSSIRAGDVPAFVAAQLAGAILAWIAYRAMFGQARPVTRQVETTEM